MDRTDDGPGRNELRDGGERTIVIRGLALDLARLAALGRINDAETEALSCFLTEIRKLQAQSAYTENAGVPEGASECDAELDVLVDILRRDLDTALARVVD